MGLEGKVEREIEVKAKADKFFKVFSRKMHLLPDACSEHLHSVEVHHGDWETVGSVKHWNYNLDGTPLNLKEKVEELDEEKRVLILSVIEGDVVEHHYKYLKVTIQVNPKEGGGEEEEISIVKWTLEYEKWNEDVSPPDAYLDVAFKVTKNAEDKFLHHHDD